MSSLVITHHSNGCSEITLNNLSRLNALNFSMIKQLFTLLTNWKTNDKIYCILLTSNHSKSFCAGGDMIQLANSILHPLSPESDFHPWQFTYNEYRLNLLIVNYPKPIIALIDGYIMGGGAGLGINAHYTCITKNATFAMPEVKSHYFADCLLTWQLIHLEQSNCKYIAEYLILCGMHAGFKEMMHLAIAQYFIANKKELHLELISHSFQENEELNFEIEEILNKYQRKLPSIANEKYRMIDECFGESNVHQICVQLQKYSSRMNTTMEMKEMASEMNLQLLNTCPLSLQISLKLIRDCRSFNHSIIEHAQIIYGLSCRMLNFEHFYAGVQQWMIKKERRAHLYSKRKKRFAYDCKHSYFESIEREEHISGILCLYLYLPANILFNLRVENDGTFDVIDIRENHKMPDILKITDIVHCANSWKSRKSKL